MDAFSGPNKNFSLAYPTVKPHEMALNNVLNFKQLIREAATKRICNKDGSKFANLSLIKPRPENVSTNLVVKPVQFIPKKASIDEINDSDIECLGIFPCIPESNQSLHKTIFPKKGESEQKLIPDVIHKIKGMQHNNQLRTNEDISLKSPVGLTIGNAKNNRSVIDNFYDKHIVKSNFGANLKREVRYINLPAKKSSLDLELKKSLTKSSQLISASKENSTVNTGTYPANETPSKIATGNIIRLPTSCSDLSIESLPQIVSQNTTNNSLKDSIFRHFDRIKPKLNNTVVIENKTNSQGETLVHHNHEIKQQPLKKISVEKETQTDIYCWLFKNDNLYTADSDEANCINYEVVPVEKALITSLFSERELISADEKGASKDLFKGDYIDRHQNITTKESSYPLISTLHPKDFTDCFQTALIQDQKLDQFAAKTHLSSTKNSFVNNTNQNYENIQSDKQLKFSKDMRRFPPSVTKLFNKICADIHSCQIQDAYGNMPLHQAVIDNHINRLKSQCIILKTIGSHLDHLNSDEDTALMIAVKLAVEDKSTSSNYEAVSVLVQEGADQSIVDMEGYFPLLYAVKHGNVQLVNILLSAKDAHKVIEKFGHDGYAPLHLAAIGGVHEIVHLLMTSGANVNVKDRKSGRTAYFHAVEKGNEKAVAVLLAFKADTYEPNLAGQLPPVVKTTKLNKLMHSFPKRCKSIAESDYLNKVEIPPKLNSIISPYESAKKEKLSEDGNPLYNVTNLEKVQNDNLLSRTSNLVPVDHLNDIGSIKSSIKMNESNTHTSSLKNNLNTSSSKRLLSSKLLAQPKVFKLLKPNPSVSRELVIKQGEQESDLVIQKTAKGTRSVELRDRPTGTIKSILPVPAKTVEKLSASEDLTNLPNILLSRNTTLCKQNFNKQPSIVIRKDCGKKQSQKYTLANFFSRFDETTNLAENNTNSGKESKNDSNKEASRVPESNVNITYNGSNNCDNKATSSKPGNNVHENTLNLYGGDEILTSALDDTTNNLESSNLEIKLTSSKAELNSVSEEGLIQNVCVKSSVLEKKVVENTNNHFMVEEECKSIEPFSETTECTIVEPIDEIELCELDVVNGKQLVSVDLYSNINASAVISDCSYTRKNTDIMYINKNASDESEIIGSNNVQLTFNTYLDNVVDQSVESNLCHKDISNGDVTFSNISEVKCDGLQQQTSAGRPRKRSSSIIKPEAKNMSDEMSSTPQIKIKRIKKL